MDKTTTIILILSRISPIPRTDIYLIKINSNVVLTSMPRSSYIYLFPVGLPVKILKSLLPSSILPKWPVHLNLLDIITLNGTNYEVLHCGACSTPHSYHSWDQVSRQDPVFKSL